VTGSNAEREAARRATEFENKIITHRQLRDAAEELNSLRGRFDPETPQDVKARALFVVGDSGSGKSTLFEEYYKRLQRTPGVFRSTEDGDIRPVIHIKEPNGTGKREFVKGILDGLGYPAPDRLRASDIIGEIAVICRRMQVELILVDEAHELVKGKGEDNLENTREFIKKLLNRTHVQFAFAGVPDLLSLRLTDQMDRRSIPVVRFDPYDWGDIHGRASVLEILAKMQRNTGLQFEQPLDGEFMSPRVYYAIRGLIGLGSRLLSRLIVVAARQNLSTIRVEHLAAVWHSFNPVERPTMATGSFLAAPVDRRFAVPPEGNPFLADDAELDRLWALWANSPTGRQPYPGMTAAEAEASNAPENADDDDGGPKRADTKPGKGKGKDSGKGKGRASSSRLRDPFKRRGDLEV
jgi:hypothetical protein